MGLRLAPPALDLSNLSPAEMSQVLHGSYLVNGAGGGCGCHNSEAGYLAGGDEFFLPFSDLQGVNTVVARNLTPDIETGMHLSEAEFIESMQTGKDFHDSTPSAPQRMLVMPWQVYRFMSLNDLKAMYAYLQRIPPVYHDLRNTFNPPFPAPPIPLPAIPESDPDTDPNYAERGLHIPQFFSDGPDADAFVVHFNNMLQPQSPEARQLIGRGSYLVNALATCADCHTDGDEDGVFDAGLIPMTVNINTANYLAGGVNVGPFSGMDYLGSRNLTPDATTGMALTEDQFIQTMQFGADFSRPGGSLRIKPHFPAEYHLTLNDLRAIYAYLQTIPAIVNDVDIVP